MVYLKIDPDKYVKVEGRRATVLKRAELLRELAFQQSQLALIPEPLTDRELLAWARENYPGSDLDDSRVLIQDEIARLEADLAGMK